ncbi:MAG TPA: hypothetical protein VMW91_01470 [Desulfosporosinus sp.]|nr:hypothetical protein [Desulfosporosinus sp.]
MDCKAVLQEQVRELQKLSDENMGEKRTDLPVRINNQSVITSQIIKTVNELYVKGLVD